MKRYVLSFNSTHHAILAEGVFKSEAIEYKMIPTPRHVSLSCGLSIVFNKDDLDRVNKLIEDKRIEGEVIDY